VESNSILPKRLWLGKKESRRDAEAPKNSRIHGTASDRETCLIIRAIAKLLLVGV